MPVGIGFDIHRLVEGRSLKLGGVSIPHDKGLLAHSDGDVLLHAITDALLGAMGLGDIGEVYPDTDPALKDADSIRFLRETMEKVRQKGWVVESLDSNVVAEEPRLGPHKEAIRKKLASELGVPIERVAVKAKTMEGLGPIGHKEAMAAMVVLNLIPGEET